MAVGAGLYEAHRDNAMGLAIGVDIFPFVEPFALHQWAASVGLAIKDLCSVQLGYKPVGELRAADSTWSAQATGAYIVNGWFT